LNKTVNDPKKLKELFNKAQNNLELIKRQVILHIALIITYLLYLHANQIEFEVEKKRLYLKIQFFIWANLIQNIHNITSIIYLYY
jgi:hypothetical protein